MKAVGLEEAREAAGTGAAARAMEETARVVVGRGRAKGAAEVRGAVVGGWDRHGSPGSVEAGVRERAAAARAAAARARARARARAARARAAAGWARATLPCRGARAVLLACLRDRANLRRASSRA